MANPHIAMMQQNRAAQKAGQMDWLGGVILGESLYLTTMTCCTFLGVEAHGPVTGCRKLTMRLEIKQKLA